MQVLEKLKAKFGQKIEKIYIHNERRIYLDLKEKNDIKEVALFLFFELGLRFNIASGSDTRKNFEILYHFSDDKTGQLISVRVTIDKSDVSIVSITPYIKAVEWIEREMHELLGIDFIGHPNMKPLLLAEDWPKGKFPLRHDEKSS